MSPGSRWALLLAVASAAMSLVTVHAQNEEPDGPDSLVEAIVYTTLRPANWDIYLFEEPAAPPRRLSDHPALDYNAVFSPDGRWVVFTSERSGSADLYALDLEGGVVPMRLTHHPAMDDAATLSPDGDRLAFVSTRDGYADIFVMDFSPGDAAAESRALNLTHRPGGDFNPAFSPDGRRIAFSRQEHLWASASTETDEDFAVELYIMEPDGSNPRRISEPGPGLPGGRFPRVSGSPAWSRDGQAIYFYRLGPEGFEIRRTSLDGSGEVHIAPEGLTPAVRPDGGVAFVRPASSDGPGTDPRPRSGRIVVVTADGSVSRLESEGPDSCFAPDFDTDSPHMVCHGPGPVDGVVLIDDGRAFAPPGAVRPVDLPDRTLTVRGVGGGFPALGPSGDVLTTLSGISAAATRAGLTEAMTEALYVSAVDGGGLRKLFTPPSGIPWGAAVAVETGRVVLAVGPPFSSGDTRLDIWKVHIDGSNAMNLTPDSPANDALPHISADGRRIVFRSSRDGDMAIYIMDGEGDDVRRLNEDGARETMPALSRDGDWVVFATDRFDPRRSEFSRKIWIQRADGSDGRLLEPDRSNVPDLSVHPRFSPDGRWVVFTSNRAGFNDEWPLTWFPQPYGDLWAVPVAGGPTVRLTDDKWEDGPNDWGYVRLPDQDPEP